MSQHVTLTNLIVTNILPTGSGFGIMDEGDQVFIPSAVMKASGGQIGDYMHVKVIPNRYDPKNNTQYMAIFLSPNVDNDDDDVDVIDNDDIETTLEDRVIELIGDGCMTTSELAFELNFDSRKLTNKLLSMWGAGLLAKAEVYGGGNKRASFCMWAKGVHCFVAEDV